MKAMAICPVNNRVYFKENDKGELDLFRPKSFPDLKIKKEFSLCVTMKTEQVKVCLISDVPTGLLYFTPKVKLSPDAFYAMQVFKVKSKLTSFAAACKKPEQDFTHKLIGLMEMIFQGRE